MRKPPEMVVEGVVRHHISGRDSPRSNLADCACCDGPHVFAARVEGVDGGGTGWLHDMAWRLPEGTRLRITAEIVEASHE